MSGTSKARALVRQIGGFLFAHAKWWLIPFLIVLGLVGGLLIHGMASEPGFSIVLF